MKLAIAVNNLKRSLEGGGANEWCITNPNILGVNQFLVVNGVRYTHLDGGEAVLLYKPSEEAIINFQDMGRYDSWLIKVGVTYDDDITVISILTPYDAQQICKYNSKEGQDDGYTIVSVYSWKNIYKSTSCHYV